LTNKFNWFNFGETRNVGRVLGYCFSLSFFCSYVS
jgi:hypothetical protein